MDLCPTKSRPLLQWHDYMENVLLCKSNFLTCVAVTAENLIRLYKRETSTLFRKQIVISLFHKFIAEIHLKKIKLLPQASSDPKFRHWFLWQGWPLWSKHICNLAYLLPRISKKETATQKGTKIKGSSHVKFLPFWNGYPAFRNCCTSGRVQTKIPEGIRRNGKRASKLKTSFTYQPFSSIIHKEWNRLTYYLALAQSKSNLPIPGKSKSVYIKLTRNACISWTSRLKYVIAFFRKHIKPHVSEPFIFSKVCNLLPSESPMWDTTSYPSYFMFQATCTTLHVL